MTSHKIVTREQWAAAREELLAREKEHTRLRPAVRPAPRSPTASTPSSRT